MGGRGASSGTYNTIGGGGPAPFYDRTSQFAGISLHEFENAVRDRKTEYMAMFDKNGNLLVAGTSGRSGSVAVPDTKGAYILTHNHPYNEKRAIGATFSEADIKLHASKRLKETRAVSNGPNENTYIMRTKNTSKANYTKLYNYSVKVEREGRMNKLMTKELDKAHKNGKKLTAWKRSQLALGVLKRVWKDPEVTKAGFEYVEVKEKHW